MIPTTCAPSTPETLMQTEPTTTLGIFNDKGELRPILPADCEIAVMGKEGDVKTIWNPDNADEVAKLHMQIDGNEDAARAQALALAWVAPHISAFWARFASTVEALQDTT